MDFHSLTRKELQTLCKQNGIPANITNVAMADSLAALQHVEGLEELLNQSPEKAMIGSVSIPRTAARTTTRRKAAKEEPESSQPLTRTTRRAATRKTVAEEVDQEKTEVPQKTPAAAPTTRRRAPAASARQKTEAQTETTTSVQRAYSTRRSVRLLGKTMAKMSLDKESNMASSIEELSTDTTNFSEQSEGSVVKGSDMQTVSDMSSKGIDASEVSSELKSNRQDEDESLLKDSKMDVTVVQNDDSMPKSGMESEVSAPKSASDFIMITEVMDESNEESSAEADKTADDKDEGAQDLVVAKDSDDVTAVQSALPQEVNEPPSTVKTVNPISLTLSSTPTKSPACKICDMNVAPTIVESKEAPKAEAIGDYSGKFDFESDSSTEGDESTEDEAVDEASSELQDSREGSEEEDSDDDSAEGESSEEEDSDDDISEGESSEDEAGADGSEKNCAQKSLIVEIADGLVDANLSKAAEVAKATHLPALAAAHEEEGFAAMTQTSSLLPANLATQFPRPTSAKSSGKKQSKYIYDDNEESLDTSKEVDKDEDLEGVEMEKHDEDITEKEETAESFEAKSLRQLKKMLKYKLNIVDSKKDTNVVEKPRIALKEVPENQMAVNEN
ncbi:hypothetical protein M0R45_038425 [Rubus argutus]|uniref:Uncharacterized protein n=1 Tax=Rubus argutus TaxID=59490 RepID=A0AAW1W5N7_RUBAR